MRMVILLLVTTISCWASEETKFVSKSKADTKSPAKDNFALGALFGNPTALSAKFWTRPNRAVIGGIGFTTDDAITLFGDYIFHFDALYNRADGFAHQLKPYVGVGGAIRFSTLNTKATESIFSFLDTSDSTGGFYVRVPIGVEWLPHAPFGLFAELVPGLGLLPRMFGLIQGGAGLRYYF